MTGNRQTEIRLTGLRQQLVDAHTRISQLETALDSRTTIEQAKGVLHERLHLTTDDAFQLLRLAARTSRQPIHQLAAEIVATPKTPAAVVRAAAKQQRWRAAVHQERNEAHQEMLAHLNERVQGTFARLHEKEKSDR